MRKYYINDDGFIEDVEIDDFLIATRIKKKQDLVISKEYFEHEPMRSYLFEEMFGEIHNRMYNIGDHEVADRCMPDIFAFTEDDVINCLRFDELPDDWQKFALACIEKYFENTPKK